jgi:hypothetical protein
VTSVIDIGGQDMKYLKIKERRSRLDLGQRGLLVRLRLVPADLRRDDGHRRRSSPRLGVGRRAAGRPGRRCTVFMNSSVKQAQKEGASIADISAGLSYSVVRNALYKVIKLRDPTELGDKVVVQGGTFLNDAVLRAFELLTGVEVVRPNIAGLMGAYGAALTARHARRRHGATARTCGRPSAEMARDLDELRGDQETADLQAVCQNHCKLTISDLRRRLPARLRQPVRARRVPGGQAEEVRGAEPVRLQVQAALRLPPAHRRQGHPRRHRHPARAEHVRELPASGSPCSPSSVSRSSSRDAARPRAVRDRHGVHPSENVCYPAKLAHGHIEWLLDKGIKTIFYPCVSYERRQFADADNNFNCPVVAFYPQVLGQERRAAARARGPLPRPVRQPRQPEKLAERLVEIFADWDVSLDEARRRSRPASPRTRPGQADIKAEGDRALQYMREHEHARHRAGRTSVPHRPRDQPRHPRDDQLAGHGGAERGRV